MTKSELYARLADKFFLIHSKREIKEIVDAVFDEIKTALIKGDKVQLLGFGNFSVHTRRARIGCNPRTGEDIQLPEMRRVHFTQSEFFKGALNK